MNLLKKTRIFTLFLVLPILANASQNIYIKETAHLPDEIKKSHLCSWSTDGNFFAWAINNKIYLCRKNTKDPSIQNKIITLQCSEQSPISCFTFNQNNDSIIIIHKNGTFSLYSISPEYKELFTKPNSFFEPINSITPTHKGNFIATINNKKNTIGFYKITQNSCTFIKSINTPEQDSYIKNIEFDRETNQFIINFYEGRILQGHLHSKKDGIWLQTKNLMKTSTNHIFAATTFAEPQTLIYALPNQKKGKASWTIFTKKNGENAAEVGIVTGKALTKIATNYPAYSKKIAISNEEGSVFLIDEKTKSIKTMNHPNHTKPIQKNSPDRSFEQFWFDENQNLLYGISRDGILCAWDLTTKKGSVLTITTSPNSAIAKITKETTTICLQKENKLIETRYEKNSTNTKPDPFTPTKTYRNRCSIM